jgi:hypothetical protein
MRDLPSPLPILALDPHLAPRSAIEIVDRPALFAADHRSSLGPQSVQFAGPVAILAQQLHIFIAVEQQVRSDFAGPAA